MGRFKKFTVGGMTGAAVGGVAALLLAPDSGPEFQRKLRERIQTAKSAGLQAKADKEAELIRKFRTEVSDPVALKGVEDRIAAERIQAATTV
jgi:gas vesicle protein